MMKRFIPYLGVFTIILFFIFRDLIFNISTNLLDWRDYPYIIWVISQSVNHISNLDFVNFFDTNAFYPHRLTLLFSDILLPQSIILLPFFYLTKNLILSFNITFLITFVLNFIALFLFWKQIFQKEIISFFGSLLFIFSPFFHLELSHFQMLSYWPYFFALYILFKDQQKQDIKKPILVGFFLTIQFITSVYLSVYLIFSIFIYYFLKAIHERKIKSLFLKFFITFFVFLSTSGVFIKGYLDMKNIYNTKREIKEYITYSAHLSDYLFTSQINSLVHKSLVMQEWNKADKNWSLHSSFPGFLIFILSLFGLFQFTKNRQFISIKLELDKERLFFVILIISGFIFSLGPRLNFNGNYAYIPLPYFVIVKFIPIAEAIRVPSRWSFLFFLGLIYFALILISRFTSKSYRKLFYLIVFLILIAEYVPINIQSTKEEYINNDYQTLKKICSKQKKVLLEIPLTHLDAANNIIAGLNYISKVELASTFHGCLLVNGYSGYDLPQLFQLKNDLYNAISENNTRNFLNYIKKYNVDLVKFNPDLFIKELNQPGTEFIKNLDQESQIKRVENYIFSFQR